MSSLAPLLEKRRVERQSAEQALARALSERAAANSAAEGARAALAAHLASAPELRAGASTGVHVLRAAAFAQRHTDHTGRLKRALQRAEEELAVHTAKVGAAQRALATAGADERAVEQHLARGQQAQERARHRREQDAQDEQAAARIFARKDSPL